MIEDLFYLGYACSSAEDFGESKDAAAYKRLAKKMIHAANNFGGMVLLSFSEWELLYKAKILCSDFGEVV